MRPRIDMVATKNESMNINLYGIGKEINQVVK